MSDGMSDGYRDRRYEPPKANSSFYEPRNDGITEESIRRDLKRDSVSQEPKRDYGPPAQEHDPVRPSYYRARGLEVDDFTEAFELSHKRARAVEYIVRAGKKGDAIEDLRKAIRSLEREISRLERP